MTLADTVGAVCAYLNLPQGADTSTVESKTNFFRPVRAGTVDAVARPLHIGRSFIVVQTDVFEVRERVLVSQHLLLARRPRRSRRGGIAFGGATRSVAASGSGRGAPVPLPTSPR
ncbi:PaaI family thioesterase [Streptomyces sp. NPDC050759]|uniref:PaaI family thioesterase n=1 Tax=Streptomyces sp. NPDC050759 TaxID=3365635 RepID=UPI0037AD6872